MLQMQKLCNFVIHYNQRNVRLQHLTTYKLQLKINNTLRRSDIKAIKFIRIQKIIGEIKPVLTLD